MLNIFNVINDKARKDTESNFIKNFEHLLQLSLTHRHLKSLFYRFLKTSIKKFRLQKYSKINFEVFLLHVSFFEL